MVPIPYRSTPAFCSSLGDRIVSDRIVRVPFRFVFAGLGNGVWGLGAPSTSTWLAPLLRFLLISILSSDVCGTELNGGWRFGEISLYFRFLWCCLCRAPSSRVPSQYQIKIKFVFFFALLSVVCDLRTKKLAFYQKRSVIFCSVCLCFNKNKSRDFLLSPEIESETLFPRRKDQAARTACFLRSRTACIPGRWLSRRRSTPATNPWARSKSQPRPRTPRPLIRIWPWIPCVRIVQIRSGSDPPFHPRCTRLPPFLCLQLCWPGCLGTSSA